MASLTEHDAEEPQKATSKKPKGKRLADIQNLPVIPVNHMMTEEELIAELGEDGWYQLEDEIDTGTCHKGELH